MKVIFDFDDVLFNAKGFKEKMFSLLLAKGYDTVTEHYERVRTTEKPFSLKAFLLDLDDHMTFEEHHALYEEIMGACRNLVNEEVVRIMKTLGKENCYIVTNGDPEFQIDKIRRSIGEDCVRDIVVVSGDKQEAIATICKRHKDEDVLFTDDKLTFLRNLDVESCPNLKTVLFNEYGLHTLLAEIEASQIEEEKMRKDGDASLELVREAEISKKQEFSFPL